MLLMNEERPEQILKFDTLVQTFKRRAKNLEFPATSFLGYLQFSLVTELHQDAEKLIVYGFTDIYEKLGWFDKIHALDIALKIKHPKTKEITDLISHSLEFASFNSMLEPSTSALGETDEISTHSVLQLCVNF